MKLNLGCGRITHPEYINVDIQAVPGVDLVLDMERRLPFRDNSFEEISSRDAFEHIVNIVPLFDECWRVLEPDGLLFLHVPHYMNWSAFANLGHHQFFTVDSFYSFTDRADQAPEWSVGASARFRIERSEMTYRAEAQEACEAFGVPLEVAARFLWNVTDNIEIWMRALK